MDVRKRFLQISKKMNADFESSKDVRHNLGKGVNRENILKNYLSDILPEKFSLGKGEIFNSLGDHSPESDIVIFDKTVCPKLLYDEDHALFPAEVVYGVLQVKSSLTSKDLEDAYKNIVKIKKIFGHQGNFQYTNGVGMYVGMSSPKPLGIIVAFEEKRSNEAVVEQLKTLDNELEDLNMRPDFVVILNDCIIGTTQALRHEFNVLKLPKNKDDFYAVSKSKDHTLLKMYMRMLAELTQIVLEPFKFDKYLKMPLNIGHHKVHGFHTFMKSKEDGHFRCQLNASAIQKILNHCSNLQPKKQSQIFKDWLGQIPVGYSQDSDYEVLEYNPNNLPYLDISQIIIGEDGRPTTKNDIKYFHPNALTIDGKHYSIDLSSLDDSDFDWNPTTPTEFFAEFI